MEKVNRLSAVKDVLEGMTKVAASDKYGISRQTIAKWVQIYKSTTSSLEQEHKEQAGKDALEKLSQSKGRKPATESFTKYLSLQQKEEIRQLLNDTLYARTRWASIDDFHPIAWEDVYKEQFLSVKLWTVKIVRVVIAKKYGIWLSYGIVERMLKAWGYLPRNKKEIGFNSKVKEFLKQKCLSNCKAGFGYRLNLSKTDILEGKDLYGVYYVTVYESTSCKTICAINHHGHYFFIPIDKKRTTSPKNYYYSRKYPLALAMKMLCSLPSKNEEVFILPIFQKHLITESMFRENYIYSTASFHFLKTSL